jgi:hypothetical protein
MRRSMLGLIRKKSCKRCGGDLSIECDIYGVYIECIQCGASYSKEDLKITAVNTAENPIKTTPPAAASSSVKTGIPAISRRSIK